MRLGIFGGSFDPVHYGHLLLAESAREQARLDEVWFVPAAVPPHKQAKTLSDDRHRVEMLQLAIGGHKAFQVSEIELQRGGASYTFETLEQIHAQRPSDDLFFLMGGDSLRDLSTWRNPQRICELASILVVHRPDALVPDWEVLRAMMSAERFAAAPPMVVEMPLVDFSSTDIRARVAQGRSIRYRLPPAVEKYIETQRLYRGEK
jgi:nicotinate-nucleotide adenylyltransferase